VRVETAEYGTLTSHILGLVEGLGEMHLVRQVHWH
jgi:hypothetical protein